MPAYKRNAGASAQLHHCAASPIVTGHWFAGQPHKSGESRVSQKVCYGNAYFGQCLDLEQEVDGCKRVTTTVPEGLFGRGALCPRKQALPNVWNRMGLFRSRRFNWNASELRQ